jgi:hypothetical protein
VLGGLGVVAGAVGVVVAAVVVDLVVFVAASGSVYWLSPADGPWASATAGGTIATSTSISTNQALVARREGTLRVLQ